jgi:hypothetical protein
VKTDSTAAEKKAGEETAAPEPAREAAKTSTETRIAQRDNAQLGRIDQSKALKLPREESVTAESRVLRPGVTTDRPNPVKERTGTIRPGGAAEEPPQVAADEANRRALAKKEGGSRAPASESDKDSGRAASGDRALRGRPVAAQRRIAKKTFRLIDGTWIDKDYRPDKDLPAITLVRDSDVFNEHLSKHADLRTYVNGFSPTDRVIVVYKDTVYKIIPPEKQD